MIHEFKSLKLNQFLMGECFRDTSEMQMTSFYVEKWIMNAQIVHKLLNFFLESSIGLDFPHPQI
jgi:hypothetical protein